MAFSAMSLTNCDTIDSHTARQAQEQLVGMSRPEFFACAGLPNRTLPIDGQEYDTWDFQPFTPDNSFSATLPLIGGIAFGSGGSCHATAIFQNNRLMAINYAGDTGGILGHAAECVSIVNHCMNSAKPATGKY
jgi:hypothetical protein